MANTDTAGKALTGCSCLSVLFFFVFMLFLQFGLGVAMSAMPNANELWGPITAALIPISWASRACCCLSGVGLIVGVVLIMTGRNKAGPDGI